jgi:aminoglycoside 3-N-acetyltransferase
MLISLLLNDLLSSSPYLEVLVRHIYWRGLFFRKYSKKRFSQISNTFYDINKLFNFLGDSGIQKGQILILHSSYDSLKNTKLTPNQIINKFVDFLGPDGTLAMNAGRTLGNKDEHGFISYDLNNSRVWTGVLPAFLVKYKNAVISKFPINSMVAIGPHSNEMMKNNIAGKFPTSCGPNSSWKYCLDNNAWIVGIGIDLTHSLTMIHVAEECAENWPIKDWYDSQSYRIIDSQIVGEVTIKFRKEKWGKLHFAERTLYRDLLKNDILKKITIDGLNVELINSKSLIEFLKNKNKNGYPYFFAGSRF